MFFPDRISKSICGEYTADDKYEGVNMEMWKKNRRRILLYLIDVAIYFSIYALFLLMQYCFTDSQINFSRYAWNALIFVGTISLSRLICKVYFNVWRYSNCLAYIEMVCADAIAGLVGYLITWAIGDPVNVGAWKSISVVAGFCLVSLTSRFIYQELHKRGSQGEVRAEGEKTRIAIIGAGMIGSLLAEELLCYRGSRYLPVFFIDSDNRKAGNRVVGLPVYGDGEEALAKIRSCGIKELIVTIPQLELERVKRLFEYYGQTGCKIKVYDFPSQSESDEASKRVIREVKIEDLLFRDTIKLLNAETKAFYQGKTVLVTGGGGSIGSELCRQIAKCEPKKLVIFDIYENNAYDIQQELIRKYGDKLDLSVEIGSVRDRTRLDVVFENHRPEIVFHAAAHKHVPLMERSNGEAIKNNVFGTYNTADMAEKYGVEKFILVSTDKAVNPTNVMGATKRMCEMVVQCRTDSKTAFSAVRFGNVLGSNGSVIPLFNRQIAAGGPVTITDKRVVRYFMTIPEASGLVMQAGAMAKRGELFVLDMGKPVKIIDLAINMIKFSGLEPYRDIMIEEIGLRPGEKLYEELLVKKEDMQKTDNDLIFIEHEAPLTRDEVEEKLAVLREAVQKYEHHMPSPEITETLRSVVPTFYTPETVNKTAEEAEEMKNAVEMAH